MGAERNSCKITANTDKEAYVEFAHVTESARYNYGHAGYTGTFAEKEDVDLLPVPDGRMFWTEEELENKADEISKWEFAVGGLIAEKTYFIVGWCSS